MRWLTITLALLPGVAHASFVEVFDYGPAMGKAGAVAATDGRIHSRQIDLNIGRPQLRKPPNDRECGLDVRRQRSWSLVLGNVGHQPVGRKIRPNERSEHGRRTNSFLLDVAIKLLKGVDPAESNFDALVTKLPYGGGPSVVCLGPIASL